MLRVFAFVALSLRLWSAHARSVPASINLSDPRQGLKDTQEWADSMAAMAEAFCSDYLFKDSRCPSGYLLDNTGGNCLLPMKTPQTFANAQAMCATRKGRIYENYWSETNEVIRQIAITCLQGEVWLGAMWDATEDNYMYQSDATKPVRELAFGDNKSTCPDEVPHVTLHNTIASAGTTDKHMYICEAAYTCSGNNDCVGTATTCSSDVCDCSADTFSFGQNCGLVRCTTDEHCQRRGDTSAKCIESEELARKCECSTGYEGIDCQPTDDGTVSDGTNTFRLTRDNAGTNVDQSTANSACETIDKSDYDTKVFYDNFEAATLTAGSYWLGAKYDGTNFVWTDGDVTINEWAKILAIGSPTADQGVIVTVAADGTKTYALNDVASTSVAETLCIARKM